MKLSFIAEEALRGDESEEGHSDANDEEDDVGQAGSDADVDISAQEIIKWVNYTDCMNCTYACMHGRTVDHQSLVCSLYGISMVYLKVPWFSCHACSESGWTQILRCINSRQVPPCVFLPLIDLQLPDVAS